MKRWFCLGLALICLIFTCSCGGSDFTSVKKYSMPDSINTVASGTVADNGKYSLTWDKSMGNLILYNKETKSIWASTPYEYYSNRGDAADYVDNSLCSSLVITCVDEENTAYEYYSYDSVFQKGTAYSIKIENGIRVIYFFDEAGISVPVDYTLTEKGLKAEVLVSNITEKGDFRLYKVSVLPNFASATNSEKNYIFVPSGSGALMYTDSENREVRYYSEMVYGDEASQNYVYEPVEEKKIKLPVFGAKNGENGVLGIIENGSELAFINADVGNAQIGYSNAYANFQLRGMDTAVLKNVNNLNVTTENITDALTTLETVSVTYIPLENGGGYNQMAAAYREYLTDKGYLNETEKEASLYVEILGAAKVKKNFFGISYDKVAALTTIDKTKYIIDDIVKSTGSNPVVTLKGYGKGGLDYSSVAGGYTLDSSIGSKKELKNLFSYCNEQKIPLLMDFDLINYTSSGNGFSASRDTAYTANNVAVKNYSYTIVTHEKDSDGVIPKLLSRRYLTDASQKLLKAVDKLGVTGVSLSSLSNTAYGDYKYQKYFIKVGMAEDVTEIISSVGKNTDIIGTDSANLYAALLSDYIKNTPSSSSKYLTLDCEIPFYQMVFKGYISQASEPINLAVNPRTEFLNAVSCGIALNFTACESFDNSLIYGNNSGISGSIYEDIKDDIFTLYAEAEPLLNKVSGAYIESFETADGISKTVFSNGVTVYVNKTDKTADTPIGKAQAYGFVYSQKGN